MSRVLRGGYMAYMGIDSQHTAEVFGHGKIKSLIGSRAVAPIEHRCREYEISGHWIEQA
jgi:hypothetical protein